MADQQVPGTGNGDGEASAASASPATVGSSAPSPRRRKQDTQPTSPVERLEIFQSAFNDLTAAGIPATALRSKDNQTLVYKIGARQCPSCKQPRPLWYFSLVGNSCKGCNGGQP